MDVLDRLTRRDKWALAGGRGALSAPPFPKHLTTPGFWDECYLADIRLPRLFALLFVRPDGRPVRSQGTVLHWNPSRLRLRHDSDDFTIEETRCVTAGNAFASRIELVRGASALDVFVWSLLDVREPGDGTPWTSLGHVSLEGSALIARWDTAWPGEIDPDRSGIEAESAEGRGEMLGASPVWLAFGADAPRKSHTVNLAQRHEESPLYELSMLPSKLRNGRLPGDFKLHVGVPPVEGLAHLVAQYRLEKGNPLTCACGTGLTKETAKASLEGAVHGDPVVASEASWRSYFASVPQFRSSDPFLTNAYWYRWFGLRLNTVDLPGYRLLAEDGFVEAGPFVNEGIGFFRNFVSYSAQAHLREVSWMRDPRLATGILDNLAATQRRDGSFPGHSYSARPPRDFYHADFGTPITQLLALQPEGVDRPHLAALRRYADYLLRSRTLSKDPAGPTLYDVFDQNETGQEYMSRYLFASETADRWESFRVSGVDATVYAERTFAALAAFRFVASPYGAFAEGARRGLAERCWDEGERFFCDVSPQGERSPARPATGLYALLVPGLEAQGREAVRRWLANPEEFWLPSGFPATAKSDTTFSAEGEWRERRTNCPWNGRSWPMANSHLVDGLARLARATGDSDLRRLAAEALMKSVRLMFHEGDPNRPNSFEHYDPITGQAALYRGYDDYMHSWVVDLILRHACGIVPGTRQIDPLPIDAEVEFDGILVGNGGTFGGGTKS
jgi:hypothetical protein